MRTEIKNKYEEWADRNQVKVFNTLSEVVETEQHLSVGDKVMFTNSAGITFEPYEVIDFTIPYQKIGGCIFIDSDSWWYPNKPEELTKLIV